MAAHNPSHREPEFGPLAVPTGEAARLLSVSVDFFTEHIAPELRAVRRGRLRLYLVADLKRWLDDNAEGVAA